MCPGLLNLFFATLLAIFSILSFVRLGFDTLAFFDPTRLMDFILVDLVRDIGAATPSAPQWRDQSYQAWHQREAEELLATYGDLVTIASGRDHLKGRSVSLLVSKILDLLKFYAAKKHSIPTESLWFKRSYQHRRWLTADYATVHLALTSGRGLDPQVVPDHSWVEDSIYRTVQQGMEGLIAEDCALAAGLTEAIYLALESLSSYWNVEEALRLHRAILPAVRAATHAAASCPSEGSVDPIQLGITRDLTSGYAASLSAIVIGLSKRASITTADSLRNDVRRIHWDRSESIYVLHLPRQVIEAVEFLQKTLSFEQAVERNTFTPDWYRCQIVARKLCQYLSETVVELVTQMEVIFPQEVDALLKEKRVMFALELIRSGLETCDKYDYHMQAFVRCYDDMSTLRKYGDDSWPTINREELSVRVANVREHLLISLAKAVPRLNDLPDDRLSPDYLGEAFYRLGHACYGAMAGGNEELFSKLFPAYFRASLQATAGWRTELDRYDDIGTKIMLRTEPITDLLDISGFAILYSELDGKNFKEIVTREWDKYLDEPSDPSFPINLINAAISRRTIDIRIAPGDVRRTRWKQGFDRQVRSRGLPERTGPLGQSFGYRHPSKLIRIATSTLKGLWVDAHEIFLVVYLSHHPKGSSLSLDRRTTSLAEALQREEPEEENTTWED